VPLSIGISEATGRKTIDFNDIFAKAISRGGRAIAVPIAVGYCEGKEISVSDPRPPRSGASWVMGRRTW
jgi:hypothetical protein